jgi:thioredoxin 1
MSKFSEIINSEKPTLVDFSAEWCGPCKMMAPVLQDLAGKMGELIRILKVDIDRNPEAARFYNVKSVPTLVLFKNGTIKWRQSGVVSSNQLIEVIKTNS